MAEVSFEGVSKVFPDGTVAVDDARPRRSATGSSRSWSGPSGSGKSTALRMLAGLEDGDARVTIQIGDRVVNDVAPRDRDIAMVFQSYALYPHMSVADNMGFALRDPGRRDAAERSARAGRRASPTRLGIARAAGTGGRAQLSGRPAPARRARPRDRARARRRSSWTSRCRTSTPSCASRCARTSRASTTSSATTVLYVTHDQVEAMTMGDRVAVMRDGRLEQVGTPQARLRPRRRTCSWPRSSARRP